MSSFQTRIDTEDAWQREVGSELAPGCPGYLQVIEVFSEWCGPSKGVVNALKKICFDHSESKVKFYAACADTCDACAKFKGKCTPAFLFIKDGRVVGEVAGVDLPTITKKIMRLLPVY
eukprot:PRCOL_00003507-RA